MRQWKCPNCKRVRKWEKDLVMKMCVPCQVEMEVVDYE
jgi:hypothetical protein